MKRRRPARPLTPLNLSLEHLEDRRLLTADPNFPGNDNAPVLDLTGLAANSLTINAGATASFNLYDIGATLADTQDGTTFADFAAGRLLLRDTGLGATLSTSGAFEFTPAESNRSFNFTVMALDRPTTAGQPPRMDAETFTIMVRPPNQAPTFTVNDTTPTVAEDSGAQSIANFATNIDDGDAGTQTLNFNVVLDATATNTAGLFAPGGEPAIDASGTLTYTPAADANGSATFNVTLMDDGGTAAGGVDTSAAQSITITVTPVNDGPAVALGTTTVNATEDTPIAITDISITDKDVDETPGGTLKVTLAAGSGTITLTPAAIATLDFASAGAVGDGDADATMTFFGTLANVNAALAAGVTYQGNLDFNTDGGAPDMLTVTVDDQGNTGAGGNLTDSKQIAINVAAVDDLPTIAVADQTVLDSESTLLLPPIVVSDVDLPAGNEIAVTVGVTAGTLAVLPDPSGSLSTYTGDGTAALTLQGTLANVNAALARIFYTPVAGAGTATLSVTADDQLGAGGAGRPATASATLTVVADTNAAPVITDPTPPAGSTAVTLEPTQGELFTQVFTATDTPGETLLFSVSPEAGVTVPDGLAFVGAVTETPIDATTSQYTATLTWPADKVVAGTFDQLFVNVADAGIGPGGLGAKGDSVPLVLEVIQVLTVTTTDDVINPADDDTNLGLREAIILANTTPGKAKILVPEGEYKLTITGADEDAAATGDLDITETLEIVGTGDPAKTIVDAGGDAGGALGDRVFDIREDVDARLENLTITGGRTTGGSADGGGVRTALGSTLVIAKSVVSDNSTTGSSADGGGIGSFGPLQLFDTTVTGNTAHNDTSGGIYASGTLAVTRSTISGNNAGGAGGGIYAFYGLTVADSTISGNNAYGGAGGGIRAYGGITITNSTISGNNANGGGGGVDVRYGNLTVSDSTISGNTATGNGGGIYGRGYYYYNSTTMTGSFASGYAAVVTGSTISGNSASGGAYSYGGGIGLLGVKLTVAGSTISGNKAGHGAGVSVYTPDGDASTILNSTVSGNTASVQGGGVYSSNGDLEILHSTITANTAPTGFGGGIASYGAADTSTTLGTSIVAGNMDAAAADNDLAVVGDTTNSLVSAGFNVIGSGAAIDGGPANAADPFAADASNATGVTGATVNLGPLADNGGTTQTHAVQPDSPAIDKGNAAFDGTAFDPDLTTDQRGAPRVKGARIDAGAFESDLLVDNLNDEGDPNPGDGVVGVGVGNQTLRAAVQEANSQPGHNTIYLGPGTHLLKRNNPGGVVDDDSRFGDLDVTGDLTIIGAGVGVTIIDAQFNPTTEDRLFHILSGANVHLVGVTLTGGSAAGQGGGALVEDGTLTLVDSAVINNESTGESGGGLAVAAGAALNVVRTTVDGNTVANHAGAIFNAGTLLVDSSTLSNNEGGIVNSGTAVVRSSTISGTTSNGTGVRGGAILNEAGGTVDLLSSTVTNNSSFFTGGLDNRGGVFRVGNSIVAENRLFDASQFDLLGTFVSLGNNLIGSLEALQGFEDGVNNDQAGIAAPIDPDVGPLADNGGPTLTHSLKTGSPALNAGSNLAGLVNDQRGTGFARVVGGQADVGAVELQVGALVVDTDSDASDDDFSAGNFSLREALVLANAGFGETISFDPTFFATAKTIDLTGTLPVITRPITIDGPGAGLLTLDGGGGTNGTVGNGDGFAVLLVDGAVSGAPAVVRGVTVTGGDSGSGGGFRVEGSLVVEDSVVTGNGSGSGGGGFYVATGASLDVRRTTISDNMVGTLGGGIAALNNTTVTIVDSTLSGNETGGSDGGGIANDGDLTVRSSTISGNQAGNVGGGIHNTSGGTVTLTHATVTMNTAANGGGGLTNENPAAGSFEVGSSVIAENTHTAAPLSHDVAGSFTTLGHNLIGELGLVATGFANAANGDQVGTFGASIDPVLGPLANNGGPTLTHAPLVGSPLLDAGDDLGGLATDQTGAPRTVDLPDGTFPNAGDGTDIGAVEAQSAPTLRLASTVPLDPPASPALLLTPTRSEVAELFDAAQDQLLAAGFDAAAVTGLDAVNVQFVDLADGLLGTVAGPTIYLDDDAAGAGWFVDDTPTDAAEFELLDGAFAALEDGPADGRVDLLTTLTHELGHVLGEDDRYEGDADHWMFHELEVGQRRRPTA